MAKNIMIQGTMSNAGKSLLCAGLCRIFRQDGYRVAPFKSQNMALNSFITADGGEMGRAQVVQAEAAGVLPDVRMNPVLLKPTTDVGSQVIVNGVAQGNMSARENPVLLKPTTDVGSQVIVNGVAQGNMSARDKRGGPRQYERQRLYPEKAKLHPADFAGLQQPGRRE